MNSNRLVQVCRNLELLLIASLFAVATAGCGGSSATKARVLPAGAVSSTGNPLVAQYSIAPTADATVHVEFGPDTNYGFSTSDTSTPSGGGQTNILVAGMKQNSTYHMRAVVKYTDGTEQNDADQVFTTGAVPGGTGIPAVTITTPAGIAAASGVELASLNPASNQLRTAAFDPEGNLVWYYDYDASLGIAQPIKLLSNGHLILVLYGVSGIGGTVREIDLAGSTVHEFTVHDLTQALATAGYTWTPIAIHHDILSLANGHFILLVNSAKDFTDVTGYPGVSHVIGDYIVDLDETYKPVWVWSSFDHLDVNRHPMNFPDWTHSNSLVYSQDDGNLLLSIRHQHWVIKIDYQNGQGTGDVLWRLGHQGDFALDAGDPANWFYAQHSANIVSPNSSGDFQLALFDNGDNRVMDSMGTTCGSGGPACYSRATVFEVNEAAKTAHLNWSYQTAYSFWGGAIQQLENTNMYFDITTPADNPTGARIMEVTQEPIPQVIWQMDVNGQNSYRTIHLPSLYPGVQW
jgi:hypothetical protein